jgi:predicted Fe-S protein YdhL (DUF1289 family)
MLDAQGLYCMGCYRTRQEVGDWLTMSDEERAAVIAALPARKDALNNPK